MDLHKLAMVGVGSWGQHLLRNFCALLGEERVIACDTDTTRLAEVSSRYPRVHTNSDIKALLDDSTVEAFVIATPVVTHYALARRALQADKHVFVEKPIALHTAEAQELIALAEDSRRILMIDHLLQYHPAVEKLRQLLLAGELGEILHVYSQRLNFGVVRTEENVLWSLGPHDIAVMLDLLGEEPSRVYAHGSRLLQERIEDVACVYLEFPGGATAYLHLSWLDPQKTRRMVVVGTKQMAIFDDLAPQKLVLCSKYAVQHEKGYLLRDEGDAAVALPEEEPLRVACAHFLRCIERGEKPRSDGYDGLHVLRVLEAAQRSLTENGRPVGLEEVAAP
jgi:UDP-2-acetamido-3-amino-2,3-dideoxy-glucuronate N-acetyltransferase